VINPNLSEGHHRAMTEAADLIAQLHSQSKLATPRGENRKIQHEIENLKTNEHASQGAATSDLSNDTKNHAS
jgi:Asp/Glu/hydantoin racemase